MEKYQEFLDVAKRKLHIADHMLTVTYPMIRDTKLLVASIENLFLAFTNTMGSLLHFERLYKRIPPFNNTFDSKFFLYTNQVQDMFQIDHDYANTMRDIKNIILEHKKSPVEFSRQDKFVICSENYETKVLTYNQIKDYLNKAKLFIQEINSIILQNGRKL